MSEARLFEVVEGSRLSSCRSCCSDIYWGVTSRGKRVPVSEKSCRWVDDGVRRTLMGVSHFADCPNASEHRKG